MSRSPSPSPSTASAAPAPERASRVITVRVAGFGRRVLAAAVDAVCLAPVLVFLGWIAIKVTGLRLPPGTARLEGVLELLIEGGGAVYALLTVALLIGLLYGFLFTAATGATVGKRLLGLRVINVYGEKPQPWRTATRCLGVLLSAALLGLGLLWIGFDREKRGLHDWLAGTYVIRAQEEA
jgi:uncharacterized RDD family membrane protein YckC